MYISRVYKVGIIFTVNWILCFDFGKEYTYMIAFIRQTPIILLIYWPINRELLMSVTRQVPEFLDDQNIQEYWDKWLIIAFQISWRRKSVKFTNVIKHYNKNIQT